MATGLALMLASFCNATHCDYTIDRPKDLAMDPREGKRVLGSINGSIQGSLVDEGEIKTILPKSDVAPEAATETEWQKEMNRRALALNGKTLKVATYNNYPVSWVETDENNTLVGKGVAFLVLDVLRERFNFSIEVVKPNLNYITGGTKPEDSLIGLVNSSAVDMAAAFLPTLVNFRHRVRFSTSLDEGVWAMMLKRPRESATGTGLLAPFDSDVWYLTLAAVFGYVPCLALITHLRAKLMQDNDKEIPLSPSMWFVYSAFIKQSTTMDPVCNTNRLLFATWWIFILLLSSFYTANLTAFLTLSKFTLDIKDPRDLYKMNYRWMSDKGDTVEYIVKDPEEEYFYLNKMVQNGRADFKSFEKDSDYLPLVFGGTVLVKERLAIDHMMYADYLKKTREGIAESDRCIFVASPHAFVRITRAFAYPYGSELVDLFDPVLRFLLQGGIIDFLGIRDLPSTKMCPLDLQSKDRKLRNTDLLMTYMLMLLGLVSSISAFAGEILLKRHIKIRFRKGKVGSSSKRKKGKKLKFKDRDESRPPPYDSLFGNNAGYKPSDQTTMRIVNGREYYVVTTPGGDQRLIPMRTPSAFLYR